MQRKFNEKKIDARKRHDQLAIREVGDSRLSSGAIPNRRINVVGQRRTERAIRTSLRGGDRVVARQQLLDVVRLHNGGNDIDDTDAYGSGKLLVSVGSALSHRAS